MSRKNKFVFAGAPYSNSAPLIEKLTAVDSRVRIIHDHPANLLGDLNSGRADVALIPVVHLFRHPELRMIPGLGVAADGPAKSVFLKCHVPVSQIKTIQCDRASVTSNRLAQLLFEKHFGQNIKMTEDVHSDASVMIGDRALCSDPAPEGDLDLAETWKEMTGLPFVFAVWAVRKDFEALEIVNEIAQKAYEAGVQSIENIAKRYAKELGKPFSFWKDYLGHTIHYKLNERDMEGFNQFKSASS